MDYARKGRPLLGICNGFQILTESGLLPGALIKNKQLRFLCERRTRLSVASTNTLFTSTYQQGQVIEMPIAHGEGNFTADEATIKQLEDQDRVVFRYVDEVNGSVAKIAGICNEQRNILGLMPHPERNLKQLPELGYTGEGRTLFESVLQSVVAV